MSTHTQDEAAGAAGRPDGAPATGQPDAATSSAAGPGAAGQPSEAELRAAYEAELSRVTSADVVLQATVSLLNVGARRLGLVGGGGEGGDPIAPQPGAERDLEQVRDAIDAVRGLMPVIERRAPQEARPLRDALAQLQMAYAREAGPPPATQGAPQAAPQSAPSTPAQSPPSTGGRHPGPAESSGRLWVPGR